MRFVLKKLAGRKRWRLDYTLNGTRFRPSFKTKELAQAEQARVETQVQDCGTAWLSLSESTRTELMSILREIDASGETLRGLWDEHKRRSSGKKIIAKKLGEAYQQYLAEREALCLSKKHLGTIRTVVGRFVKPRAAQFVTQIARQNVVDFLQPYADETFNSYRHYLYTFFGWCRDLHFGDENPVALIKAIDRRRLKSYDKPPGVLHYDDCKALLKATLETDPRLLRYVAVCLFAGLRPEREAAQLQPADITDKIQVRAKFAKDRQQRYVEIVPALKDWLALPLPAPEQGPRTFDYPIKNLRKRFEAVRVHAGLIKYEPGTVKAGKTKRPKIIENRYPKDCLRHTFASAFYTLYGADRTIAAMGHGDYDMLFSHYRRLMTKEEAEKILSISPAVVTAPPPVPVVPTLKLNWPQTSPKVDTGRNVHHPGSHSATDIPLPSQPQ